MEAVRRTSQPKYSWRERGHIIGPLCQEEVPHSVGSAGVPGRSSVAYTWSSLNPGDANSVPGLRRDSSSGETRGLSISSTNGGPQLSRRAMSLSPSKNSALEPGSRGCVGAAQVDRRGETHGIKVS